ncbi:MAG: twin-arginine translocation signal domain-containing protein [Rhodospirillales bacterium]|nr:twin-arginine translocation signal domain-containing protein [Rhodospirillales bacterium]
MATKLTRRDVMGTATIAAAMLATSLPPRMARAQEVPVVPKMEYAMKKLPFDPAKVPGLSEKLLVSHYENNYGGAVKRLNAITAQLAALNVATAPVFVVNGLKREELIATNSMIIHELYFDSLAGAGEPDGALAQALARDFGSLARWKAEFAATGKALGGGSGWVLLNYSPRDKRLVNSWAADHTMTLAGGRPILALDMYEHAYQMDYGARAAAYVDAFMQHIRWANAMALYERYARET